MEESATKKYEKIDFYGIQKVTGVFGTDPDSHSNALVRAQRYGSEDPDPHSNPYQNVTDPKNQIRVAPSPQYGKINGTRLKINGQACCIKMHSQLGVYCISAKDTET
jgi:hypothetical protein